MSTLIADVRTDECITYFCTQTRAGAYCMSDLYYYVYKLVSRPA